MNSEFRHEAYEMSEDDELALAYLQGNAQERMRIREKVDAAYKWKIRILFACIIAPFLICSIAFSYVWFQHPDLLGLNVHRENWWLVLLVSGCSAAVGVYFLMYRGAIGNSQIPLLLHAFALKHPYLPITRGLFDKNNVIDMEKVHTMSR